MLYSVCIYVVPSVCWDIFGVFTMAFKHHVPVETRDEGGLGCGGLSQVGVNGWLGAWGGGGHQKEK